MIRFKFKLKSAVQQYGEFSAELTAVLKRIYDSNARETDTTFTEIALKERIQLRYWKKIKEPK